MGTVIPYDVNDWALMRIMRGNINFYRETDSKRYDLAIKKSDLVYKETLKSYTERAA